MNTKKTKIITKSKNFIGTEISGIEIVEKTTYLGQIISFENWGEKEVNTRISKTWKKYWALRDIFKGNLNLRQKGEVFYMCVLQTLTYGSETWTLDKKTIDKIRTTQNAIERSILNIKNQTKYQ